MSELRQVAPTWTMADRLRKAREHSGLTGAEFATETGISRRSITNYERGHSTPGKPMLLAWALAAGVDLAWLERGE
jgi:transcriptional regulator with XRE-family HTH domain